MARKKITHYYYNPKNWNTIDMGYEELSNPDIPANPLKIPELLQPDKIEGNDVYYTVSAQPGETQILPGAKTKTYGYNDSMLGKTIVYENGKNVHVSLENKLPLLTTFHWHGLNIKGPIDDGGCHAPVYPGQTNHIDFTVNQPAATLWLHAHPCPYTGPEVWKGLATMVIVKDEKEAALPLPRTYGVDDIPVILTDRTLYEDNQLDYFKDLASDGMQGHTNLVNATAKPYFDVTTKQLRIRVLNGANRREYRLHFDREDFAMTQIASDGGLFEEPVDYTKVMITAAERMEFILDFSGFEIGETVTLMNDDTPILEFRIKDLVDNGTFIPDKLVDLPDITGDDITTPTHFAVMGGTGNGVEINGRKFDMTRIDDHQTLGKTEIWEVQNTNSMDFGMIHPFHIHSCQFRVISRDGHAPYENELGFKDTIAVESGEKVLIQVKFDYAGVFMYHCHIIEHEDGGMMAQLEVVDPEHPDVTYDLMTMEKTMKAFSEELNIPIDKLWVPEGDACHMHMEKEEHEHQK